MGVKRLSVCAMWVPFGQSPGWVIDIGPNCFVGDPKDKEPGRYAVKGANLRRWVVSSVKYNTYKPWPTWLDVTIIDQHGDSHQWSTRLSIKDPTPR